MSDDWLIHETPDPAIKWSPEDYGFESPEGVPAGVWYKKNLELRARPYEYWLLRKKKKNERGNSEMLVKWWVKIPLDDKDFAEAMFTKGLK